MLKLFKKIPVKYRWAAFVAFAFGAFGSFITSTSYYADKHHSNAFFTILGIVLSALVLFIGYSAWTEEKAIESEDAKKFK